MTTLLNGTTFIYMNYDITKIKSSLQGNGKVAIMYKINHYREEVLDVYLNLGTANEKVIYQVKSAKQASLKHCRAIGNFENYNRLVSAIRSAPKFLKGVDLIPTDPQREEECYQDR